MPLFDSPAMIRSDKPRMVWATIQASIPQRTINSLSMFSNNRYVASHRFVWFDLVKVAPV